MLKHFLKCHPASLSPLPIVIIHSFYRYMYKVNHIEHGITHPYQKASYVHITTKNKREDISLFTNGQLFLMTDIQTLLLKEQSAGLCLNRQTMEVGFLHN